MKKWLAICLLLLTVHGFCGEDANQGGKASSAEERRREFASIQKELEVLQPAPNEQPTREQALAYLELSMEKLGKFARGNPKTPEGFDAAFKIAGLLVQANHPEALNFVELAATCAPSAGVDIKRVVACWAMITNSRMEKHDITGAREALEHIKPLDDEIHRQLAEHLESAERLQPGKEPFPIDTTDVAGKSVSLAALKGKVVVIDFWAPWCGPCMGEMPNLKKLYESQHTNGLEVVGISLDQNEAELNETLAKENLPWQIVSDHKGWKCALAHKWGVQSIPQTFVLDRKGIIRHVNLRGEELDQAVEKLLAEKQ